MGTSRTFDQFLEDNNLRDPDTLDNELEQSGVKGMKWGVRRSDAELARAAKSRKSDSDDSGKSEDHIQSRTLKTRSASSLSNKEMQDLNNRLNLEEQYARLTAPKPTPASMRKQIGKKLLDKYIENEIGKLAKGDVQGTTTYKIGAYIVGKKTGKSVPDIKDVKDLWAAPSKTAPRYSLPAPGAPRPSQPKANRPKQKQSTPERPWDGMKSPLTGIKIKK